MKITDALLIAADVLEALKPLCTRIEIAGSIRRGKAEVKDIELVAVPIFQADMFGGTLDDHLLDLFDWSALGKLQKGGHKMKQVALEAGINLDLFIVTPPADWGVQFVIRTGPADFSHWMVSKKIFGGALPDSVYVKDGAIWDGVDRSKYSLPEEVDFFKLCGLDWIEPGQREPRWSGRGRGGLR